MATGVSKAMWRGQQHRVLAGVQSNGSAVHVVYEGKSDERTILATPPAVLLRLWPNTTPYGTATENRLIYGDNLPVLAGLVDDPRVKGKVQLVYIDPPFATNGVFQSRNQNDAYTDLLAGADYIEFLRARLVLLREILAPTGSIYVHLDSNMAFCFKLVMDEVFGRRNFRSWITRKKCNPKNYTRNTYGNVCDFILFYSKTDEYVWHRPVELWTDDRALREYQYVDEKTGRRYKKVPVHAPGVRNGATGGTWKGKLPPPGKHWQYTPDKLEAMDARGEIYWSPTGNPRRKIFLDDSQGIPVQDLWIEYRDAHNQNIRITGYPTENPPRMLERFIQASSNPGDLVLDCFSGSGTTICVASELDRHWIGIDSSAEAIAVTMRRFAKGTEPMGDFVNNQDMEPEEDEASTNMLPLFQSLELAAQPKPPVATSDVHRPITNFTLYAEEDRVRDLARPLDQWCSDIGDLVPVEVAKAPKLRYGSAGGKTRFAATASHGQGKMTTARAPSSSAVTHLIEADPILANIIREIGPCRLKQQAGGFTHLAEAILNQQLSKSAATAIYAKVRRLIHGKPLSAKTVQSLTETELRHAGVSTRKVGYLRDLAAKTLSGELNFQRLANLSDEEVIRDLTKVHGIGRWTAEMYLIFVLARPDVFPADDHALQSAMSEAYGLKDIRNHRQQIDLAIKWRPYRTTACWYLWASRNRVGTSK